MNHPKAHLLAFLTAWIVSMAGLLSLGYISSVGRDYHTANPWGELWQVVLLFGFWSGFCVTIAWLVIALPYDAFILKGRSPRLSAVHAVVVGLLGFGFMIVATQFLPVADESWKVFAPIAALAAFLGIFVLNRSRSGSEKNGHNKPLVASGDNALL